MHTFTFRSFLCEYPTSVCTEINRPPPPCGARVYSLKRQRIFHELRCSVFCSPPHVGINRSARSARPNMRDPFIRIINLLHFHLRASVRSSAPAVLCSCITRVREREEWYWHRGQRRWRRHTIRFSVGRRAGIWSQCECAGAHGAHKLTDWSFAFKSDRPAAASSRGYKLTGSGEGCGGFACEFMRQQIIVPGIVLVN